MAAIEVYPLIDIHTYLKMCGMCICICTQGSLQSGMHSPLLVKYFYTCYWRLINHPMLNKNVIIGLTIFLMSTITTGVLPIMGQGETYSYADFESKVIF
jgi:hypothetical protein